MQETLHVVSTTGPLVRLPVRAGADGRLTLKFIAERGLCQFSAVLDAREFNWEELYFKLDLFHNKDRRTGPWDFAFSGGFPPLVPSYWVRLDGRRIGLWYFQRVSLEDLAAKRFRGRTAFEVAQAGEHELELLPFRAFKARWISARLEPDPEDRLAPLPAGIRPAERNAPAAKWADEAFWETCRRRLETTHAHYRPHLRTLVERVFKDAPNMDDIAVFVAAHYLEGRADAMRRAVERVEQYVAAPAWGNPNDAGYGHNCDMAAAHILRNLSFAVHALRGQLSPVQRDRLLEKLRLQGNLFMDLALLHRDYWGGSVAQDHGWRSTFAFGAAALNLYGLLPDAERWLSYALPRLERSVAVMPADGVVPQSSFFSFRLYMQEIAFYRDALLALTGGDLYDRPVFGKVVDFVHETLRPGDASLPMAWQGDHRWLIGGDHFFNAMASKRRDGRAAFISRRIVDTFEGHPQLWDDLPGRRSGVLWGFMAYDPSVAPDGRRAARALYHFEDAGVAHYRDDEEDVALSLRCGPPGCRTAYARAAGPCDRLQEVPDAGHFLLTLRGEARLVTPERGYTLYTQLRSCLLVDGQGQVGSIGYPMSIPSVRYQGERIERVEWDAAAGRGVIRLNLAPAYPAELGLAAYTREFLIEERRRIVMRDYVAADRPRQFSWLLHGKRHNGMTLEGLRCRFGPDPALTVEARAPDLALQAGIHETDIVWSYSSTNQYRPFDHLRYDAEPAAVAAVEFVFTW